MQLVILGSGGHNIARFTRGSLGGESRKLFAKQESLQLHPQTLSALRKVIIRDLEG